MEFLTIKKLIMTIYQLIKFLNKAFVTDHSN